MSSHCSNINLHLYTMECSSPLASVNKECVTGIGQTDGLSLGDSYAHCFMSGYTSDREGGVKLHAGWLRAAGCRLNCFQPMCDVNRFKPKCEAMTAVISMEPPTSSHHDSVIPGAGSKFIAKAFLGAMVGKCHPRRQNSVSRRIKSHPHPACTMFFPGTLIYIRKNKFSPLSLVVVSCTRALSQLVQSRVHRYRLRWPCSER